jgi:hypothetical protein
MPEAAFLDSYGAIYAVDLPAEHVGEGPSRLDLKKQAILKYCPELRDF